MKKWIVNIAIVCSLLAAVLLLSGFAGEGVNCSGSTDGEKMFDFTVGVDEENCLYPAYETTEDTNQTQRLVVYIPLNTAAEIPIKAVVQPVEGSTVAASDFSLAPQDVASVPAGITVGEDTFVQDDETKVITGTVSVQVEAQTAAKEFDAFLMLFDASLAVDMNGGNFELVVKAVEDIACPACAGPIQVDGSFAHQTCDACGEACDGETFAHGTCEVCEGVCDGEGYAHETCDVCGVVCDGETFTHGTCEVCEGVCDGEGYAHETCDVCGAACDGEAFTHGTCEVCEGACDGEGYAHETCDVCGALCDGRDYHEADCGQEPQITPTPQPEGTELPPAEEEVVDTPDTGDVSSLPLYLGLGVLSALMLGAVLVMTGKKARS